MACHGYDSDLGWPPLPREKTAKFGLATGLMRFLFLEYSRGGGKGDHIKAHVRIIYI